MPDTTRPTMLNRLRDAQDRQSWRQFFERYWRLIYSFARRCGLSPADSEDVVQEVVLEVFRAIPGFDYDRSKGTFRAYLRTITQRKVVDQLREAVRSPTHRHDDQGLFGRVVRTVRDLRVHGGRVPRGLDRCPFQR